MRRFKSLKQVVFVFSTLIFLSPLVAQAGSSLNIATWNIRQLSYSKVDKPIYVASEDKKIPVKEFISNWIQDRQVDVLSLQEVYEEYEIETETYFHPMDKLMQTLPAKYKMIKGESIRAPIPKGKVKVWREYCPIVFNSQKIDCTSSKDSMIPTGTYQMSHGVESVRKGHWAYCRSKGKKKFDFVITCLHTNYANAKKDLNGLKTVVEAISQKKLKLPKGYSSKNTDYIFAGDYNLDRHSARAYGRWGLSVNGLDYVLDDIVPSFPRKTLWKGEAFTKLKSIHNFEELGRRSEDVYDDVVNTPTVLESLVSKTVDPLVDSYFVKKDDKVDVQALLDVSDHLPVVAEYDMTTDTD